jgi:hypothetical protein
MYKCKRFLVCIPIEFQFLQNKTQERINNISYPGSTLGASSRACARAAAQAHICDPPSRGAPRARALLLALKPPYGALPRPLAANKVRAEPPTRRSSRLLARPRPRPSPGRRTGHARASLDSIATKLLF